MSMRRYLRATSAMDRPSRTSRSSRVLFMTRQGRRDDDAGVGAEEEIEGVERAPRSQVEDDVRGLHLAKLAEEAELPVMVEVGDVEGVLRNLDDAQVPA